MFNRSGNKAHQQGKQKKSKVPIKVFAFLFVLAQTLVLTLPNMHTYLTLT